VNVPRFEFIGVFSFIVELLVPFKVTGDVILQVECGGPPLQLIMMLAASPPSDISEAL
jgi:hypothetical protein